MVADATQDYGLLCFGEKSLSNRAIRIANVLNGMERVDFTPERDCKKLSSWKEPR